MEKVGHEYAGAYIEMIKDSKCDASFNKRRNQIPYAVYHQTWKFYGCNK